MLTVAFLAYSNWLVILAYALLLAHAIAVAF